MFNCLPGTTTHLKQTIIRNHTEKTPPQDCLSFFYIVRIFKKGGGGRQDLFQD